MRIVRALLWLVPCLLAAGCGEDEADPQADAAHACRVSTIDVARARVPRPMPGLHFGQEIWLSYHSPEHEGQGYRFPRTRDEALHKIRQLCAQVRAGADIGALARRWSNAAGGRADGLCAVPLPQNRVKPDARDIALYRTPVGALTPLLEWRGGFWFARRIAEGQGQALGQKLAKAAKVRARARIIHIHHAGAWPRRVEFDRHPQAKAIATARWIIAQARNEEEFAALAKKYSNDVSRTRGGLLETKHPTTGETTEWIRWGDRNFPQPALEVILEHGTPGAVHPEPVVSGWGVDVVFVIERRTD